MTEEPGKAGDKKGTDSHFEQYVLGFKVVSDQPDKKKEGDDEDEDFSDDSQVNGEEEITNKKCCGILGSKNKHSDEIF